MHGTTVTEEQWDASNASYHTSALQKTHTWHEKHTQWNAMWKEKVQMPERIKIGRALGAHTVLHETCQISIYNSDGTYNQQVGSAKQIHIFTDPHLKFTDPYLSFTHFKHWQIARNTTDEKQNQDFCRGKSELQCCYQGAEEAHEVRWRLYAASERLQRRLRLPCRPMCLQCRMNHWTKVRRHTWKLYSNSTLQPLSSTTD